MDHLACRTEGQCQEQSCINDFCFACGVPIEHPVGIEEAHSNNIDPYDGQESFPSPNGHLEDHSSEVPEHFEERCVDIHPLPDEYSKDLRDQPRHYNPSSDHYTDWDLLDFGPYEEDKCSVSAAGPSFNEHDDVKDVSDHG